jgi:alpha-beta hydrolase superfamily lysophospholipase
MTGPPATPSKFVTSVLSASSPDDPAIRLAIVEKRPAAIDPALPPLLIAHGASFPGRVFDLPQQGFSLMEALAADGRVVYALDVRGFGLSRAPAIMDLPPGRNPPFATIDEAVLDLAAAAEIVLAGRSVPALDLAGFSWGGMVAARFAAQCPERVRRLALYAPIYRQVDLSALGRMAVHAAGGVTPEAYGLITQADVIGRWDRGLPGEPAAYRNAGLPELLFETIAALDDRAETHSPPAFRCPRGPLHDLARIAQGESLFDPAALSMPVLVLRGADDTTSTDADCRDLLARIAATDKCYEAIAPGSHFLLHENNRTGACD